MSDEPKPLLVFPQPVEQDRSNLGGGPSRINEPSHQRQIARVGPKLQALRQMIRSQKSRLSTSPDGSNPEQVLVLELTGTVDEFFRAVDRVSGLEWLLGEIRDDIEPDDDFYRSSDESALLKGRVYFIGTNQKGMQELISLWNKYEKDQSVKLNYGLGRFKKVFRHLKEIRKWNYQDRLREKSTLENWKFRLEHDDRPVRFEAELWYHPQEEHRDDAYARFRNDVREGGGRIISQCTLPAIRYHGVLAELPAKSIQGVIKSMTDDASPDVKAMHCESVMSFRPSGQIISQPPADLTPSEDEASEADEDVDFTDTDTDIEPLVALLDGLPIANHELLEGRLLIDDPDGFADSYPANARVHGTAMASLIIHGDRQGAGPAMDAPLYVRPIMRPDPDLQQAESLPDDVLAVDLIHRAVRRMFEGDSDGEPVAPSVKVINFSIGDPAQPLDAYPSAWARLLDWLSQKYNVLFNVSAGNHTDDIEVDVSGGKRVSSLSKTELQKRTLNAIYRSTRQRRLLAPAESINSITVGSAHADESASFTLGPHVNPIDSTRLPSPINALGLGFNRSVKPDILMPGGRSIYSVPVTQNGTTEKLSLKNFSTSPPGQLVASPGRSLGGTGSTSYTFGTSNATALASRQAFALMKVVEEIRQSRSGHDLADEYTAVILKALLAHGASWADVSSLLKGVVGGGKKARENASRLVGYGRVDREKALYCTEERATIIGYGKLTDGQAHDYSFPLPNSLSAKSVRRELTITLAWFTPINSNHAKYRRAHLWFDPPTDKLNISREEANWLAARRGTLQHEVIAGDSATPIVKGDDLSITVNCRSDAGSIDDPIRYGIVASLEVAPGIGIPIYNEVRSAIQSKVRLRG